MLLPGLYIRWLTRKRLRKLENQLVGAVQTLASGVRAGLNLVQAMQMVSRDAPIPIKQEFAHLVQEYEYGIPLDDAMNNAALPDRLQRLPPAVHGAAHAPGTRRRPRRDT